MLRRPSSFSAALDRGFIHYAQIKNANLRCICEWNSAYQIFYVLVKPFVICTSDIKQVYDIIMILVQICFRKGNAIGELILKCRVGGQAYMLDFWQGRLAIG